MNVIACIEATIPTSFILETVPALVSDFSDTFEAIMSLLQSMAGSKYEVHWDLHSTKIHGGLPHNRPRAFHGRDLDVEVEEPVSMVPTCCLCALGFATVRRGSVHGQLCPLAQGHATARGGDDRQDHEPWEGTL